MPTVVPLQNYWQVSLLAIWGKIFERIIFYTYSLLCQNQSGFRPLDSCENQVLSIVHDIHANFEQHSILEARANFLSILKAIDEV